MRPYKACAISPYIQPELMQQMLETVKPARMLEGTAACGYALLCKIADQSSLGQLFNIAVFF